MGCGKKNVSWQCSNCTFEIVSNPSASGGQGTIENICPVSQIDAVGISMTAELVDAYDTIKDGVLDVV